MFLVTRFFQAAKRVGGPLAEPEQIAMQPVPKSVAVARTKTLRQFQRQWSVAGTNQIFPQLNFVRREYADAAPAARNGDIPLLGIGRGLDGGIGKKDMIHGFAL